MRAVEPTGISPQSIISSSVRPASGPTLSGVALGFTSNVCGTRCADAGPGLSEVVTFMLRCASWSLLSGVGTLPPTVWIGAPA